LAGLFEQTPLNIYIAGFYSNRACYWLDKQLTLLDAYASYAYSISVFTTNILVVGKISNQAC